MSKIPRLGRPAKNYPFAGMRIGGSFDLPKDPTKTDNMQTTNLLQCAKRWAKRNGKDWRFRTAAYDDVIKIWRVE